MEVTFTNRVPGNTKQVGLIKIDKAQGQVDVEDVRLSRERDPVTQRVIAEGDLTPDRARAFELVTTSWVHEARENLRDLKKLNYDSVEEPTTMDIIKQLFSARNARIVNKDGRETITYTRGNPNDAAAINQLLTTPLGAIAVDITERTPIGKQSQTMTIGRFEGDSDLEENPSFLVQFG